MKKTSYLWSLAAMCFAVTLSAGFASCGDDDDDPEPTPTPVEPVDPTPQPVSSYLEPYQTWGATKATVKNYMKDYELLSESDTQVAYYGKDIIDYYFYGFENAALVFSEIDYDYNQIAKSALESKLTKAGYEKLGTKDSTDYYLSADEKTYVWLSTSDYYEEFELIYIDYEWWNSHEPDPTPTANWKDPYIVWGASKAAVKNYMSDYTMYGETDGIIAYYGKDDEDSYWYFFDSAKLVQSEVDVPLDVTTLNDLYTKLTADGYQYLGAQPDTVNHFVSTDQATYIFLVTNSYYGVYEVAYCDYAALDSRSMTNQTAAPAQLNWADFKKDKQQIAAKKARKQNNVLMNKANRMFQMRTKIQK
mgnify:CR=1 FL=1